MERIWQLQEAKARFSELFSEVCEKGPQRVSRRGKETIVLVSEGEYRSLSGQGCDFIDFLLSSPKAELDVTRSRDAGRTVEL